MNPRLPRADKLVLQALFDDIDRASDETSTVRENRKDVRPASDALDSGYSSSCDGTGVSGANLSHEIQQDDALAAIHGMNDPSSANFEPTVFVTWDLGDFNVTIRKILAPYIAWAQNIARFRTDVVMVTHLLLYFTTSVPSAIWLYHSFTYTHGTLHWLMQSWYVGTYTLMRHQHIHLGGVLTKRFPYSIVDSLYPYLLDPLHGHTWNTYFYHHIKHHHVEGNGPNDLSSTIRYQRDDPLHFAQYVLRFLLLSWLELPRYFLRKGRYAFAFKAWFWEVSNLAAILALTYWRPGPTIFVFVLPFAVIRVGLMVGNWGQHALVDEVEPDSDFRSSITLIDVNSNRYCLNDGYHTSHHLNPRRHWREHPASFLAQKIKYANEGALVFRDIDYVEMTFRLLRKDYAHLAGCLVPIGEQIGLSMRQREEMLRRKTRAFSEEEIRRKFKVHGT